MEDGYIAALLEFFLNFKAARRGDILEVHAAERACQQRNGVDDLVHILGAHTERDSVHIAESLEQQAFALHDGHTGLRADIAEAEHSGSVRHDGDGVPAAGQLIALVDVFLNFKAGLRNARSIGKAQRLTAVGGYAGGDLYFAPALIVQREGFFHNVHIQSSRLLRYASGPLL